MSTDIPETVEVTSGAEPSGSVIWLHGLGADGHDFEPIVPELRLDDLALRFVFPHAPVRPVTINGGMTMRAWFDILTLERGGPQDEAGIRHSAELLDALVDRELERGIAHERIVLAGFSQGGAIALHAGLRREQPLGGIMALSTYLPLGEAFEREVSGQPGTQPASVPIFMAHGSFDPIVPLALGQHSRDTLEAAGYAAGWHEYPMAHAVCAEEIAHVRDWLLSIYS